MKEGFYAQLIIEAKRMIQRFIDDKPGNFIESVIFNAIREIGEKVGEFLQDALNKVRGAQPEAA